MALRINLNSMPLNNGLKYDPTVIFLNDLQIPTKLMNKPGIHRTCTGVQVSPVIHLDNLSNEIKWKPQNICSEYIPLWECLPVCHSGSLSFLCPLLNSALGATSKHSCTKIYPNNCQKITPMKLDFIRQKNLGIIMAVN